MYKTDKKTKKKPLFKQKTQGILRLSIYGYPL